MFEGTTLYLQSVEEGEIRLRPVVRGEKLVTRMIEDLELRLLGAHAVINRRGRQVGFIVKSPSDISEILKAHAKLREDLLGSVPREEISPINLMEMVFLETPR